MQVTILALRLGMQGLSQASRQGSTTWVYRLSAC